ncbi:MAG: glycoside hydrolase family 13 protein [Caldilinea sp.]|nr:glycoside hydrolase family 13 protein [Caldilinea sp.]MCW5843839.1 glycoside hydrolase family 13 protein [Caldilinea sp.]
MSVHTPDWVKNAVFYQIFPDRFARSPRTPHMPGLSFKPWGSPPEEQGFQGGDLYGIVDRLDYLQELGVNAIYLNPIFASASNHRYHTFDYMQIDPLLGGNAALRELLDAAHARHMYVVLDGVFNHASRGFWAFHHILECGGNSPYIDWFTVRGWPLRPYEHDADNPHNYDAWWNIPALPKFNIANEGVRQYLLDVARYWIDFGIDGWRLDVPEEIDDADFWRTFRKTVKEGNPDAYIVGEIWHEAREWLRGDRFDAVMNYVFSRLALGFFGAETLRTEYKPGGYTLVTLDARDLAAGVHHMYSIYSWEVAQAQMNLLDSHDTARTLWTVGDDESALRLCTLFQMTMPGAPCVYYGDEIGMTGATDPFSRGAFPWHDTTEWNQDLLDFFRRTIALRNQHAVLRTGAYATIHADKGVFGFIRTLGNQHAVVLFNSTLDPVSVDVALPASGAGVAGYQAVWNSGSFAVQGGALNGVRIPPRDAVVLLSDASGMSLPG